MANYPFRISIDILDIMEQFHFNLRRMTDHDYDVGEILGYVFKMVEYDIYFQERREIFFDRWYRYDTHLSEIDRNVLGHAMLMLCFDIYALFDVPGMRDTQGCLLYRVDEVINDSTLIMVLRKQFMDSKQSLLQLENIAYSNSCETLRSGIQFTTPYGSRPII